jgi:hypothetical protein
MAHPFPNRWQASHKLDVPAWTHSADRQAPRDGEPDADDDAVDALRNRNRTWRAISWILFANVVVFWLMTCITAFG